MEHFNKVLGSNQHYFTTKAFLSRGHLAPDADFIFSSGQFATYFYANVVPQFQSINGGNWVTVEMLTRRLAEQEQTQLNIYTGTFDQLALSSSSGDIVPLYIAPQLQIEVPKYLWKIVYNSRKQSAIVFVKLNNPYTNKRETDYLCENICEEAGIERSHFGTFKRGFTYCCSYQSFLRVVSTIELNVRNLLTLKS